MKILIETFTYRKVYLWLIVSIYIYLCMYIYIKVYISLEVLYALDKPTMPFTKQVCREHIVVLNLYVFCSALRYRAVYWKIS